MATPVLDTAVAWWRAADYTSGDYITDGSGNAHNALLGSAEGADTNDPLFLSPDGYTDYDNPGTQYLYLPGTAGNYASTPDAAAISISGDLDIRCALSMADVTPGVNTQIIGKYQGGGADREYRFMWLTTNRLRLTWYDSGDSIVEEDCSASIAVSDDQLVLIRVTLDVDNGSGAFEVKFYYKLGVSPASIHAELSSSTGWTQVGLTESQAFTTDIRTTGSGALSIGQETDGTQLAEMNVYGCQVYGSINGSNLVFDADFTDRTNVVEPYATFTESSVNAATVTINRSATGAKSTVVDYPLFLLATDDYLQVADHADLDFAADESLTVLWLGRRYGTTNDLVLIAKKDNLTTAAGYSIDTGTSNAFSALIADGTAAPEDIGTALTTGVRQSAALVRDVVADTVTAFTAGVSSGSPTTDNTTATLANALPLRIGATSGVAGSFGAFNFFGAAIFRSALSAADLVTAADELMGNESEAATGDKLINLIETLLLSNEELVSFLTILRNDELVRLYE